MNIEKKKKFCFYGLEKDYADLKIRLKYDGITQIDFFNYLVKKYTTGDERMLNLVSDFKMESSTMGKKKIKRAQKEAIDGFDLLRDLGITDRDRENIFDILESIEEVEN